MVQVSPFPMTGPTETTAGSLIANQAAAGAAAQPPPCSQTVYAVAIYILWANDVADGVKMFESKKTNAFGCMDIGDLVIIAEIGRGIRVTAVAEVGCPPVVREAKREVLYSMLLAERHVDLDAYSGDAKTFSYVQCNSNEFSM